MVVGLVLLAGCGPKPASPPDPNRLVLELGGSHERLADVLERVRSKNAPPGSGGEKVVPPQPPLVVEPTPDPEPVVKQKPDAAPRQVRLGKGQTLYGLAKQELGDGNRWKEILKLNGWTEAQASRLREGTAVTLPAH